MRVFTEMGSRSNVYSISHKRCHPIDWYSFHDTFDSLIHNDVRIPAVQNFHILNSSLRGNSTTIMESLSASEESWTVAWELLKFRCDRPGSIVYTHIKSLSELPEIIKDSPSNIRNLKKRALMYYKALEALKQPGKGIQYQFPLLHKSSTKIRLEHGNTL